MTLLLQRFLFYGTKRGLQFNRIMSGGGDYRAVFVTTPTKEVADKLAHGIILSRLAACVNILPGVHSVYEWEEKIGELTDWVNKNHPYDVPEVIALPIEGGSKSYLNWIGEVLQKKTFFVNLKNQPKKNGEKNLREVIQLIQESIQLTPKILKNDDDNIQYC
ncbi:cutA [Lepeophtheirus salmonis]|uniref:CutA n=1 Tax=Lepeophtheirus salmonis TaxID=72036 RepID=A0A7R8CM97_LEPSM|nr:cutA [Lepeophtheirus salmonis]CAF2862744.1 cutA [Lepeophtheirus salmonis]